MAEDMQRVRHDCETELNLVRILVDFHFIPSTNNYFLSVYSKSSVVQLAGDGGGRGETGMSLNLTEFVP